MKKTILLFISLLLILPIISAVEFDMKTELSQGETLMAKVSGNFVEPVLKENIFFYRRHMSTSIIPSISRIDDEYYIYAQLPIEKIPDNYSLVIKNVRYMKGSTISEENLVKNFTITEETADFSIDPGFIITEKDFYIEVQNLQDYEITINIDTNETAGIGGFFTVLSGITEDEEDSVTLRSGEIKKINFELGNVTTFKMVGLSTENLTYEIPIYAFVSEVEEIEEEINISEEQNQTITEEETTTEDNESIIQVASTKTCEELNGTICKKNEKCDGKSEYARDAKCCLGTCKEIQKSSTGKIIGWSIVIVILVFLIWFFKKKYRGAKKDIDLLKIAKGKK